MCNASQLAQWLLHMISLNYELFTSEDDLSRLESSDLEKVNVQRHPPKAYVSMLEEYKTGLKLRRQNERCCVM